MRSEQSYITFFQILSLFILCSSMLASGESNEDLIKRREFERRKDAIEERLSDFSSTVSEDKKSIIQEVLAYNSGKSRNLINVAQALQADADPLNQSYPIDHLELDENTFPIVFNLLKSSHNNYIKTKIVWRLRGEALSHRLKLSDDVILLLQNYASDEDADSNLRRASMLTLNQIIKLDNNRPTNDINNNEEEFNDEIHQSNPIRVVEKITNTESIHNPKEAAEASTIKSSKESLGQTSNRWIWLIILLIIFSAIGLVIGRKVLSR